jgi:hypothetical protein
MARFILCFSISLLTFCVGIVGAAWTSFGVSKTVPPKPFVEKSLTFKPQPRYHYFQSWAQDYELPDGRIISIHCQNSDSPAEAAERLNSQLKHADTILKQYVRIDANERLSEERFAAAFPVNNFGYVWVRVFWTDGAQLYTISSLSLSEALEFEKAVYFRKIYLD